MLKSQSASRFWRKRYFRGLNYSKDLIPVHEAALALSARHRGRNERSNCLQSRRRKLGNLRRSPSPFSPLFLFSSLFFQQPHILQSSSTLTDIQSFVHHRNLPSTSIQRNRNSSNPRHDGTSSQHKHPILHQHLSRRPPCQACQERQLCPQWQDGLRTCSPQM